VVYNIIFEFIVMSLNFNNKENKSLNYRINILKLHKTIIISS
jgi:hypothetical protein